MNNSRTSTPPQAAIGENTLVWVRHGATQANLDGLRCGGDLDPPLTERGRHQAQAAALQIAGFGVPFGVIVSGGLLRTDATARIVSAALGGVPVISAPAFAERRLGRWNLRPADETEEAMRAGQTPPGGESRAEFRARILGAMETVLLPLMARRPVLVSSRGVARVLRELTGVADNHPAANGEVLRFDLTTMLERQLERAC